MPGDPDGAIEGYDLVGIKERYHQIEATCGGGVTETIVRFAELHDPGWLYDDRLVEPDYSENPRSSYERRLVPGDYSPANIVDRGNGWRNLFVHDMLAKSGIVVTTHDSRQLDVTIEGELWEVKSPDESSARSVEGGIRKAKRQFIDRFGHEAKIRVVFNSLYTDGVSGDAVRARLVTEMSRHGISEVIFVKKSGEIEFLDKKNAS